VELINEPVALRLLPAASSAMDQGAVREASSAQAVLLFSQTSLIAAGSVFASCLCTCGAAQLTQACSTAGTG